MVDERKKPGKFDFERGVDRVLPGLDQGKAALPERSEMAPCEKSDRDGFGEELLKPVSLDLAVMQALRPVVKDKFVTVPTRYYGALSGAELALIQMADEKNSDVLEHAGNLIADELELLELVNLRRNNIGGN